MPQRTPWRNFPNVIIAAEESLVKRHASYPAAKSGDEEAAAALVQDTVQQAIVERVSAWRHHQPILVSAHAEEEQGRNAIPQAFAALLGERLNWGVDDDFVQTNIVNHTGAGGFARLARPALFTGVIVPGKQYVLVDDFIGQGGTLANMRGFIEANGGVVIGAVALTGKAYSAKLALSPERLEALRSKHGQLEQWWKERFGYSFDALTESEARYLERSENADAIRDRIAQEAQGASARESA